MLLLASCAAPAKPKAAQPLDFETWCLQSKLEYVSPTEVSEAKASEVKVQKFAAQLGGGLSVRVQRGIKIKSESSFSTTSYYELRDANGSSLAKFPSRISPPGFEGNFRIWSSADSSLILGYEWIETGVDSHEMYFVFYKEEDRWIARGIKIPLFPGSFSEKFQSRRRRHRPLWPRRNRCCRPLTHHHSTTWHPSPRPCRGSGVRSPFSIYRGVMSHNSRMR